MPNDWERALRSFDRVWRRVTDSRPLPPPGALPPPPPPPAAFPPPPPPLMPGKRKQPCRQRRCPR